MHFNPFLPCPLHSANFFMSTSIASSPQTPLPPQPLLTQQQRQYALAVSDATTPDQVQGLPYRHGHDLDPLRLESSAGSSPRYCVVGRERGALCGSKPSGHLLVLE